MALLPPQSQNYGPAFAAEYVRALLQRARRAFVVQPTLFVLVNHLVCKFDR